MPFFCAVLWGLETLVLFYWICCVCSWCMWGAGLPKWINTITSSRWLRHLVPLPVIVLMLYWLLLSREPNLHAVLLHCIPFTHIILRHTPPPFPHSPIHKPTIHFSWRSGMIMPRADWTHLSSAHTGRTVRHAWRGDQKWTWYTH